MRTLPETLRAFLATKQPYWSADLFAITLLDGTTLRASGADRPITLAGVVYVSTGVALERSTWSVRNTVEVQEMTVKFYCGNTADFELGGVNFKTLVMNGGLRGSVLQVDRAYMPKTGVFGDTSVGAITYFRGLESKSSTGAASGQITYKSHTIRLVQQLPRNTYQPGCNHTLYDVGCTLDRDDFKYTDVAAAGSTTHIVVWTTPPPDPSKFPLGTITFHTGPNAGTKATVGICNSGGLGPVPPLPFTPLVGDEFDVVWGCDKQLATCQTKFNNAQHWRGFKFVPPEEFAT